MKHLRFASLILLLALTSVPLVRADEAHDEVQVKEHVDCQRFYSSLDWKTSYRSVGMDMRRAVDDKLPWDRLKTVSWRETIAGHESLATREIFAGFPVRLSDGSLVISTNHQQIKNYRMAFDSLMEARVGAGILPKGVFNDFKKWLIEVDKGSYPKIDAKLLYESYYKENRPIYEYFDRRLLDYFRERRDISQASVEDAINSLDLSPTSRAKTFWKQRGIRTGNFIVTGAATGVFGAFTYQMYDKLVKGVSDPLTKPVEKIINDKVKAGVENIVEKIDSSLKWPDKAPEQIAKMKAAVAALRAEDFSGLKAAEATKRLQELQAPITETLPGFRDVTITREKDFETNYNKLLSEGRPVIAVQVGNYDANRATLVTLKSLVENRASPATAEELDLMAEYTAEMIGTEDQIGDLISNWLVYRALRGKANPIDETINKDYLKVYEKYLRLMNSEKLKKKVADGLEYHIDRLDKWYKGQEAEKKASSIELDKLDGPGLKGDLVPAEPKVKSTELMPVNASP